jgi:hypothetical protein
MRSMEGNAAARRPRREGVRVYLGYIFLPRPAVAKGSQPNKKRDQGGWSVVPGRQPTKKRDQGGWGGSQRKKDTAPDAANRKP